MGKESGIRYTTRTVTCLKKYSSSFVASPWMNSRRSEGILLCFAFSLHFSINFSSISMPIPRAQLKRCTAQIGILPSPHPISHTTSERDVLAICNTSSSQTLVLANTNRFSMFFVRIFDEWNHWENHRCRRPLLRHLHHSYQRPYIQVSVQLRIPPFLCVIQFYTHYAAMHKMLHLQGKRNRFVLATTHTPQIHHHHIIILLLQQQQQHNFFFLSNSYVL